MLINWAATSHKAVWFGSRCMVKLNCIEWWRSSMKLIEVSCFGAPLNMPRDIRGCYLLTVQQFSLSALPSPHLQQPSPLPVFAVIRYFTVSLHHSYYSRQASCDASRVFNQERITVFCLHSCAFYPCCYTWKKELVLRHETGTA